MSPAGESGGVKRNPKVFLCHSSGDKEQVGELHRRLTAGTASTAGSMRRAYCRGKTGISRSGRQSAGHVSFWLVSPVALSLSGDMCRRNCAELSTSRMNSRTGRSFSSLFCSSLVRFPERLQRLHRLDLFRHRAAMTDWSERSGRPTTLPDRAWFYTVAVADRTGMPIGGVSSEWLAMMCEDALHLDDLRLCSRSLTPAVRGC